ncbi:MAG: BamA/TamA family outer membrane protein [Bacteroidota bacterium]
MRTNALHFPLNLNLDLNLHLILILHLILGAWSHAGELDSLPPPFAVHGLPYIYYTPETDWAFGATAVGTFRLTDSLALYPSSITIDAYYTVRKQYKVTLAPELYLDDNRYLLSTSIEVGRIVDRFWGSGPRSEDSDSTEYVKNIVRIQARAQVLLLKSLKAGVIYEYERSTVTEKEVNPWLVSRSVRGSDGTVASGMGIAVSWDSRDNLFFPSSGSFHQIEYAVYGRFLGATDEFRRTLIDLRWYISLAARHTLAAQGVGLVIGGAAPFGRLAPLGGDMIMRGYYTGRYRDNILLAAQIEYRVMVFSRFGAVAFIGAGDVAPSFSTFGMGTLKPSCGGGLRFVLDPREKLTLRLDVGIGRGTDAIYLAIKEAF